MTTKSSIFVSHITATIALQLYALYSTSRGDDSNEGTQDYFCLDIQWTSDSQEVLGADVEHRCGALRYEEFSSGVRDQSRVCIGSCCPHKVKGETVDPQIFNKRLVKVANLAGINYEQVNESQEFIRPRNVHLTLSMIGQKKHSKVYPTSTNPIRASNLMH